MGKSKKSSKPGANTKRKYIESHWLIFGLRGLVALLAGWYIMFSSNQSIPHFVIFIGAVLISLALIEVFNMIHRRVRQHGWGLPLGVAVIEAGVGVVMITANSTSYELHIALLAGYTLLRGLASIVIGAVSAYNFTDRFLWLVCGIVGCIIGFVILADPGLSETTFVKIFGSFLMVFGITNIIFAAHSYDELKQLKTKK